MQPVLAEPEIRSSDAPAAQQPPVPGEPAAGGPGTPGSPAAPAPEARLCDACGAAMSADQDWCLECGTAAPGRLGARPGMRAILTVLALTLLLVGGAVAASYAALSEDAKVEAARPGAPEAGPVAQAPPTLPPASAPPASAVPATPVPGASGGALPQVSAPSAVTPPVSTPVAPTVVPVTPSTPTPSAQGDGTTDDEDTTTPDEDDTADTTEPAKALDLGADAVAIYDPYSRVTLKGDVADAYDDDDDTTFRIGTADPAKPMGVGLVIDLEKTTSVRAVELLTDTPGYRVETYGTTASELPPDILDARWEHFADRNDVDGGTKDGNVAGDDRERISLKAERRLRYLVLWITTPPTKGPTVRIAELDLFG